MTHLLNILALIFLVVVNYSCHAPRIMQTVNDAQKLQANEQLFIDRPLKTLLKEIGPEIKLVSVEGKRADGAISYIIFKFTDWEERKKYNLAGKTPLTIIVRIKERFEWNKPREEMFKWTREDAKKYGSLTIASIGVVGETL
jgi:hypothetical protein